MSNIETTTKGEIVAESGASDLLGRIRPSWKAKSLIERVERLLPVDPSSACQRLFNAAIHDLREKILVAGLDVAKEAATTNSLPSVARSEDIQDSYSVSHILDLAYRMGLLSRPEWRKLRRAYEIRRDLEHEDDEYEAGVEDCVYIFQTCVEIVLSKEPAELLRVGEVKELIESPQNVAPSADFLHDYEHAPDVRQGEIAAFLVSVALDTDQPDIKRQNAVEALRRFEPLTHNPTKIEIAKQIGANSRRDPYTITQLKVASASGAVPYLKQSRLKDYFSSYLEKLDDTGYHWTGFQKHAELLESLEDIGGLETCPESLREGMIRWLVLCYLGEPGGMTRFGHVRHVFSSDTAEPIIRRLLKNAKEIAAPCVQSCAEHKRVKILLKNIHIARRFEQLLDLVETP